MFLINSIGLAVGLRSTRQLAFTATVWSGSGELQSALVSHCLCHNGVGANCPNMQEALRFKNSLNKKMDHIHSTTNKNNY